MVMSITIGDLAFELRLSGDPDTAPAPGIVATLARRRAHIAKRIELYAPTCARRGERSRPQSGTSGTRLILRLPLRARLLQMRFATPAR